MGGGVVKVVIINTQYVETDAVSFKSVVQRLTGKESTAATTGEQPRFQSRNEVAGGASPVFERGMSFNGFDRMLVELPPLDELYRLYGE